MTLILDRFHCNEYKSLLWCMSQDEVLVSGIRGDLLKRLEDAPLFPEDLEDGGKEEQQ